MAQEFRRLAAIMFTDMVGYTAMTQANESQAMVLLEKHNELLRPCFPKFNGREVKTIGDSFLVEFDSALDALRCAVEIQSRLHEYNVASREGSRIRLRIGIHLGDVIHREGDVFGDAVNISSRIQPLAEPEGVCISRQVYDQVHNKFDLPIATMGEKGLKNVSSPTEVYRVRMPWESMGRNESADSRRVAVLPFSNMSPDPNDEYFADGLTEELIAAVSRIEGTEVISRTSVMQYKRAPKPVREISRELEAGTILEGSVRKAGNRLRVTVQMIDAARDRHLWAENYDRNFDDIFAIQSDIASQVAVALQTRLPKAPQGSAGMTEDLDAYALYLRAKQLWYESSDEALKEEISLLQAAIAKDPSFVRAYAALAQAWRRVASGIDYTAKTLKAEEAAAKALELGPDLAESHTAMASVDMALDRFESATSHLEKAISINPNLSEAQALLGESLCAFGDINTGVEHFAKALALDPLSARIAYVYGHTLRCKGDFAGALKLASRLRELHPGAWQTYDIEATVYLQKGDLAKAREVIEEGLRASSGNQDLRISLGMIFAAEGNRTEAEAEIASFDKQSGTVRRPFANFFISVMLRDYDRAFKTLDAQAEEHSWFFGVKVDPLLADFRKDPRFAGFCRKVGIPP